MLHSQQPVRNALAVVQPLDGRTDADTVRKIEALTPPRHRGSHIPLLSPLGIGLEIDADRKRANPCHPPTAGDFRKIVIYARLEHAVRRVAEVLAVVADLESHDI